MTPAAKPPVPLSESLAVLASACREGGVTLGLVREALGAGSGHLLLLVILLPFCQPIPLPGLSTPFGLAVSWLGAGLMMREPAELPRRLAGLKVPATFFPSLLKASAWLLGFLERSFPARAAWIATSGMVRRGCGFLVLWDGFLLALPLPLPFSNTLPAISALLLITGLLRSSFLAQVLGLIIFGVTLGYFYLTWHLVVSVFAAWF